MKIIVFDFEVFKYDTLLGTKIISDNKTEIYQTWNLEEIKEFYRQNENAVWVGHNNLRYDNPILEAVIKDKDTYEVSKMIVSNSTKIRAKIPKITYDSMLGFCSLKLTELAIGKNISTTEVDFDLDRKLTEEEKLKTESYNRDDLEQTYDNFISTYSNFELRLDLMSEFNLDWSALIMTEAQIAAKVLNAKSIHGIEKQKIKPEIPSTLLIQTKEVLDFYLNEDFKKQKRVSLNFCNCPHILASGGIHGALSKYHCDKALYFDVSGYYNLIMINYDLLPRTIPEKSKELYKHMYFEQLSLKGKKEFTRKRWAYKTILLAVFGAALNEYTDFYDPEKGALITVVGELFLIDLLEKLEGKVQVIQSNTDGIIAEPLDWSKKDEIISIIKAWESRTGFTIEIDEIENIWQRDVNNYCYLKNGKANMRGEALRGYEKLQNPIASQVWSLKESAIIGKGMIEYLLFGITPEETIEKNKSNLLAFQYLAKKNSYDYLTFFDGKEETKLKYGINRVFPMKEESGIGLIYKNKIKDGKISKSKIAGLPSNIFIYNDDIREENIIKTLTQQIDYQYYIDRIYERLGEFI